MSPPLLQEVDRLEARGPLMVTAAVMGVVLPVLVVVALLLQAAVGELRLRIDLQVMPARAPSQIGGTLQTQIGLDDSGARRRADERAKLESYGWVDRQRGVVRIPIDRAMRLVTEGRR